MDGSAAEISARSQSKSGGQWFLASVCVADMEFAAEVRETSNIQKKAEGSIAFSYYLRCPLTFSIESLEVYCSFSIVR